MRDHSDEQHGAGRASAWLHAAQHVKGHLLHGVWVVVVLTALTQFLHSLHLDVVHQLDHFFTSHVVTRLHQMPWADAREPEPGPGALTVQLLEISPELRLLALDEPAPTLATVQRLQGVRPISRAAMLELLNQLAQCLERQCPGPHSQLVQTKVLALDVDLIPLPEDPESVHMATLSLLDRLRRQVHVVLVVLGRESIREQQRRNDFIRQAGCIREDGRRSDGTPATSPGGLFLASPRLLANVGEAPLQFPASRLNSLLHKSEAPGWFPGLGNLSFLLWRHNSTSAGADPAAGPAWRGLTQMCMELGLDTPGVTQLMEDKLAVEQLHGKAEEFIEASWHWAYYNWRLFDSERLRFTPLGLSTDWPVDAPLKREWQAQALAAGLAQLREMPLLAPVLLISVEGAAGYDKFLTPAATPVPVTGASIHALQALSLDQRVNGRVWHVPATALIDALLGLVFLAAWALLGCLLSLRQKAWPGCIRLLSALIPPMLAGLIVFASLWIAAASMSYDIWFNPVYVLLGMTAHAYIEGWQHGDASQAPRDPWGRNAWREWRQAGGRTVPAHLRDSMSTAALRWLALLLGVYGLVVNIIATTH